MSSDATLVEPGVVGYQEPAFARGRVLVPLQAEHAEQAKGTELLAGEGAAVRLGAIFEHGDVLGPVDGNDGVNVPECARHVNGQDEFVARLDLPLKLLRV